MPGYVEHFGLKMAPFDTAPNPEFAYATREHEIALLRIQDSVEQRLGLCLLKGDIGMGKCLGSGTPILMYDGTVKPVEDIRVGDQLMGPDSRPRTVRDLSRGFGPLYRVVPTKGASYVVNSRHVLSLKMTNLPRKANGEHRALSGKVINLPVSEFLTQNKTFQANAKGWRAGVEFPEQPVSLDPYFLGLWLGDGAANAVRITTTDVPVVDFLEEYALEVGLQLKRITYKGDAAFDYDLTTGVRGGIVGGRNPVRNAMRSYDLFGNKHVPLAFKANSRRVRLQVLAGLIDTDGHLACGCYDLVFKSRRLAEDTAFLARSVGLAAYLKPCRKRCHNNGVEGDYYRVQISGHIAEIPVRIPRKQASVRQQPKDVLMTGLRLEDAGFGPYFGFEVDEDHLFLLGDFTVTHNSTIGNLLYQDWASQPDRYVVAFISDPSPDTTAKFYRLLLESFGLEASRYQEINKNTLRNFLLDNYEAGRIVVVLIDEAQTISAPNMQTLHHLSNEQTPSTKLIQIALLAQPNFDRKLSYQPALNSRIARRGNLDPLIFPDAVGMMRHRVTVAGGDFDTLFPLPTHRPLFNATQGIPRKICVLCDNALFNAYAHRSRSVDEAAVASAIRDTEMDKKEK